MSKQCPKCDETGHVFRFNHLTEFVRMECPKCLTKWKTDSDICPKCHKPNGFAVEGVCSSCYSKHYRSE